jgi:hypothetical protein
MPETIAFSRFPDAPPEAERPAPREELVSIHRHLLHAGQCLVVSWRWEDADADYRQVSVATVKDIHEAREWVPVVAAPLPVPSEFGIEAYAVGDVL